jgi:hypothetical protein
MEKTNKSEPNYLRGTYHLIARKYGCSRRYVIKVLENDLGKYAERDTDLVRKIRKEAARLNELFPPEE